MICQPCAVLAVCADIPIDRRIRTGSSVITSCKKCGTLAGVKAVGSELFHLSPEELQLIWQHIRKRHGGLMRFATAVSAQEKVVPRWPRIWQMAGYLVPGMIRKAAYNEVRLELEEEYWETRCTCQTRLSRSWINFCFTVRTTVLIVDCLRLWGIDKVLRFVVNAMPDRLRRWWKA